MTDPEADVPYGEDFHDPAVAAAWADAVMRKRPWRTTVFEHFVAALRRFPKHELSSYAQLVPLLAPSAEVLICDHLPPGAHTPLHEVLYMTPQEKLSALSAAGLAGAQVVWSEHNMALYSARASGTAPSP
jgi:hypothetical protein